MATLGFNHIYKMYSNGAKAVNDFTMEIDDKEFIVLVGPSGCGKSTTLRMIAGLEEITAGVLTIDGRIVNNVEPKDRDIAMVFQNYALYPHMTVFDNMAFGLKLHKTSDVKRDRDGNPVLNSEGQPVRIMRHYTKEEIREKVMAAAGILGIVDYLDRKPKAMSGGQRQRVALGRAIVRDPKVFLFDEPLSNLDAKLRASMRSEISKLHKRLKTTFVYVTHDQIEAMTMGTRIVVMKDGFIQQIDTPTNLYRYPKNKFVAGFIGTPQMNFFEGTLKRTGDRVHVTIFLQSGGRVELDAPYSLFTKVEARYLTGEKSVILGLRCENISLEAKYPFQTQCRISQVEILGADTQIYADLDLNSDGILPESKSRLVFKAQSEDHCREDEVVDIYLDLARLHLFDKETEESIKPRMPERVEASAEVRGGELRLWGAAFALPQAVCVADGEYTVRIPLKAISKGGPVHAEVLSSEEAGKGYLTELSSGGEPVFLRTEQPEREGPFTVGVDIRQIDFMQGGEVVVSAFEDDNVLTGRFHKEKKLVSRKFLDERTGGTVSRPVPEEGYFFRIGEAVVECPQAMGQRILNGGGNKITEKELELHFPSAAVRFSESGIPASVKGVLDYGTERYAVLTVGEREIKAKADAVPEGQVFLELAPEMFSVIDPAAQIRLV